MRRVCLGSGKAICRLGKPSEHPRSEMGLAYRGMNVTRGDGVANEMDTPLYHC